MREQTTQRHTLCFAVVTRTSPKVFDVADIGRMRDIALGIRAVSNDILNKTSKDHYASC